MLKKIFMITAILLATVIIMVSCAPGPVSQPAYTDTSTPGPTQTASLTPAPTVTPSPTPTQTPTPVSFVNAVGQGTIKELETYGKGRIQASNFSADGSLFAAATKRGIYVLNARKWEEISYIPATRGVDMEYVRFSRDGSLLAGGDSAGNITFWDTKTWEVDREIATEKGPVSFLDISPDNQSCVVVSNEKVLSLWNLEIGEPIKSMTYAKEVGTVYFSRDGSWIMLSEPGGNGDLTTRKADDLTFINRLPQLGRLPPNQAVSPFTDAVASYTHTTLNIHDFARDKDYVFRNVFGVFDKVQMLFINDVTLFVKNRYADSYRLYDLRTGFMREESMDELPKLNSKNPDLLYISKEKEIQSIGFDPFQQIGAVAPQGNHLILRNGIFNLSKKSLSQINLMYDNNLWNNAAVLDDGYVAVIDPSQPEFPNKEKKGNLIISILDFEKMIVKDKKYISYDLPDGISTTALSHDGSRLVTGLYDGSLYLWDVNTDEQITMLRAHSKVYELFGLYGAFKDISFDNDGSHIVTVGFDGLIKVWNLEESTPILSISGKMATFSPDGTRLVYVDPNNRIQIVSLYDKVPQVTLNGQSGEITALVLSKDGALLMSGGEGSVKIWSMDEHTLLMNLPLYGKVNSLAFSPDGTQMYVSTYDGVISVWGNDAH